MATPTLAWGPEQSVAVAPKVDLCGGLETSQFWAGPEDDLGAWLKLVRSPVAGPGDDSEHSEGSLQPFALEHSRTNKRSDWAESGEIE